jgi:prophage regulatory protein
MLNDTVDERLLRKRDVCSLTGLAGSTIYRLMAQGRFPKQIHPLGNKMAAWRASDVRAWVADRAAGNPSLEPPEIKQARLAEAKARKARVADRAAGKAA